MEKKTRQVGNLDKFVLLLWKNWMLQKRHYVQTAFEIIIPILFTIILVIVRYIAKYEVYPDETLYPPFSVDKIPASAGNSRMNDIRNHTLILGWAPDISAEASSIMWNVRNRLGIQVRGFHNESEMVEYIITPTIPGENGVFGGVVFENSFSGVDTKNIQYKIRLDGGRKTELQFPMFQPPGPREKDSTEGGVPGYYSTGFLAIQHAMDMAIIDYLSEGNRPDVTVQMNRYPFPPYTNDYFVRALQGWLSVIIMMSFIYPSMNIVKSVVYEKERRLKESMKIMGLSGWLHWAAWFCKGYFFLLITGLVITILMEIHWYPDHSLAVLSNSNPFVIMLFFCVFCFSLMCFSFLVSVFFSRASTAAVGGGVIYFLFFSPYYYIQPRYDTLSVTTKYATSLLSNTAMAYGSICIAKFESLGTGLQWSNLNERVSPDDSYTMADILMMMVLDSIIYFILALYLEAVFPGEYGVPQPWYFPFTRQYWCGPPSEELSLKMDIRHKKSELFEEEPYDLPAGIQIQNLTKAFGKQTAVNNINLNMYDGQITALLGHNGAGKTTTMSMLTGLFPPSSGTAIVNGYDIRREVSRVRTSLGLCPQHDVLYDELTVEEHLYFFCTMKGYTGEIGQAEIDHMIKCLGLEDKRHCRASSLSGGMKRKLSVGIALCAKSKVVLLDEPTSGMDPGARRFTWDLLQAEKKGRTILLTTHFMEEADLLGDRIAIMAAGELKCCGSSLFLKKRFGAGYHLVLVKAQQCDVDAITNRLQKYVPDIEVEQNVGAELSYILPDDKSHVFEAMFQELENDKESLGISSYGASITTMEEVFMRVCRESEQDEDKSKLKGIDNVFRDPDGFSTGSCHPDDTIISDSTYTLTHNDDMSVVQLNTGPTLFLQQFRSMLIKNIVYHCRTWVMTLLSIIIPCAFLIVGLVIMHSIPGVDDAPALKISLENYDSPVTMIDLSLPTTPLARNLQISYIQNLEEKAKRYKKVGGNITSHILDLEKKSPSTAALHYIVAATFETVHDTQTVLTAWFNNQPFHSPPLTLNLVNNAILKYVKNNSEITVINHPLPFDNSSKAQQNGQIQSAGFQVGFNVSYGMSFLTAAIIVFLIKERMSNAKHLQFVSGVNLFTFWVSSFIIDFMISLASAALIMVTLIAFNEEGYAYAEQQGRILLLMILFIWAVIPFMWLFSFMYTTPATGFAKMTFFNVFTGLATMITVMILRIPKLDLVYVADILDWIFMLIPNYNLGVSLMKLYDNDIMNKMCTPVVVSLCPLAPLAPEKRFPCCRDYDNNCGNTTCPDWTRNYLSWDPAGIGRNLVFLSIEGFLFVLILFCIERKVHHKIWHALAKGKVIKHARVSNSGMPAQLATYIPREEQLHLAD